jgi:hypothetical protein
MNQPARELFSANLVKDKAVVNFRHLPNSRAISDGPILTREQVIELTN